MAGSPSKPARKASATRKANDQTNSAPPTLNRSHLQGFVVGCVVGGIGCLGLFNALEADYTVADKTPAAPPALEVTVGPRFDFYTAAESGADPDPDIEPADLQWATKGAVFITVGRSASTTIGAAAAGAVEP